MAPKKTTSHHTFHSHQFILIYLYHIHTVQYAQDVWHIHYCCTFCSRWYCCVATVSCEFVHLSLMYQCVCVRVCIISIYLSINRQVDIDRSIQIQISRTSYLEISRYSDIQIDLHLALHTHAHPHTHPRARNRWIVGCYSKNTCIVNMKIPPRVSHTSNQTQRCLMWVREALLS